MGGMDIDLLFRPGLNPSAAGDLPAGERDHMHLAIIDDGEFEIAVEGRA